MKQCTRCKEYKDETEFPKNKRNRDGLFAWCKKCKIEHQKVYQHSEHYINYRKEFENSPEYKEWRKNYDKTYQKDYRNKEENKERIKGYLKKYCETEKGKANAARKHARRRLRNKQVINTLTGFDIEFLYLLQDKKCVGCGKDISDGKYHLDHIIPLSEGFGLTLNNTQLLCPTCNLKKFTTAIDMLGLYLRTGKFYKSFN